MGMFWGEDEMREVQTHLPTPRLLLRELSGVYTLWGAAPSQVRAFAAPAASGAVAGWRSAAFLDTDVILPWPLGSSFHFWRVLPAGSDVPGRNPRHGSWLPGTDSARPGWAPGRPWPRSVRLMLEQLATPPPASCLGQNLNCKPPGSPPCSPQEATGLSQSQDPARFS